MSKKMKIILIAGLAVVLLAVGIAIPVMAADTPTPTPPISITTQDNIMDRVAEKLGVTRDALIAAVKQARTDLKDKTPVTPDDYFARVAEILGVSKDQLVTAMQDAAKEIQQERINNQLDRAVQNGVITQDEENQIKDWLANRPSAVDKLFGNRFFRGLRGWGRGCWGRFGGFGDFGKGFRNGPKSPSPSATPGTTSFSTATTY